MAVTLQKTNLSVDVSSIVNSAINAVKTVRQKEQFRKEAEFQRAIADGLSYEEQVALREKQLADENSSPFKDPSYVESLTKSISDTKKLNRFNNYRTKYAQTLGNLNSGKINEQDYLDTLKSTLANVDDPDLRLEIQNDITTAEKTVKEYRDTILSNQIKKAQYDGTSKTLDDAISRVTTAKSQALISGNDDDVTAYDATLSALQAQKSTVRIQDSMTDFQVKSSTRGTNPLEKLNFINDELGKSDANVPIKIGDRTYNSAAEFWTLQRDSYLNGNSQTFGDFFGELATDTQNKIATDAVKFGYPTQTVLDSTLATFNDLRNKPEVAPYLGRLDVTQSTILSEAVSKLATTINNVGTNNLTFQQADVQLQNIEKKYGVDTSSFRLQLDEQLRNLARGGVITEGEALKMAPDVQVELPTVDAPSIPNAAPSIPGTTPAGGTRIVKQGDTLSRIAQESGTTLSELLVLNPELQKNPNMIRVGQTVNLPGAPVTTEPVAAAEPVKPVPATTPTPAKPVQPTPQSTQTPAPTATQTPAPTQKPTTTAPVTPAKPASTTYTGGSIVDYLKSTNQDSSFNTRKTLAEKNGIAGYTGTTDQNLKLLKSLRG